MKLIVSFVAAVFFAMPLAATATAAKYRGKYDIGREASCQWQARKKYSAVHVLKRRAFFRACMNEAR